MTETNLKRHHRHQFPRTLSLTTSRYQLCHCVMSNSCIDLLVTDQPNLILDSGTRPSLDPECGHQIVQGKINLKILPSPPMERRVRRYDRVNIEAISMKGFPYAQHLGLNTDLNCRTKTEIVLDPDLCPL